jgi:hypothetical protein
MNTMGKILVFFNLIFALIIGGFLAFDFAVRTNYKKALDDANGELSISRQNTTTLQETKREAVAKLQDSLAKVDNLEKELDRQKKKAVKDLEEARKDAQSAKQETDTQNTVAMMHVGELERLRAEAKSLSKVLSERDKTIVDLNNEKSKALDNLQQAINEQQAAIQRSESLLDRNRELEKKLATTQVTGNGAAAPQAGKDMNQPNPPPAYVRGKVEKVSPDDPAVAQIDVGSDAGLAVNQTLDAYRLGAGRGYLGLFRILRVSDHKALGRLQQPRTGEPRRDLRVGDVVSSSIEAR